MANRGNRSYTTRARQRAMRQRRKLIAGGAAAALAVVALVILLLSRGGADRTQPAPLEQSSEETMPGTALVVEDAVEDAADETKDAGGDLALAQDAEIEEALPETTPEPTATPVPAGDDGIMARRALTRPSPTAEGFMPVFRKAETEEKIIAITVDDCNQANNLQQIVDKALEVGGKLTIFPIGKNVLREHQSQVLKYAWENGFELENHTFTHSGLFYCSEEEMTEEVYKQNLALSQILGVEYQCHFLRPRGGDARHDQRVHMYAKQLGYYGIAHWSATGTAGKASIAKSLKPGAIYLFHTTDKDREKLLEFIPWVVEQGYQLVTLNEMFGYPPNETSPLTKPIEDYETPPLEPYEVAYVTLKKPAYSWLVYQFQQKLIELGYISGEPDGVYGEGTQEAVKAYQRDHGLEVTGEAEGELVKAILEGSAT